MPVLIKRKKKIPPFLKYDALDHKDWLKNRLQSVNEKLLC